jgi:hypothetical protein
MRCFRLVSELMAKKALARQNARCLKKNARYLQRESPACAGETTVIARMRESVPVPDTVI